MVNTFRDYRQAFEDAVRETGEMDSVPETLKGSIKFFISGMQGIMKIGIEGENKETAIALMKTLLATAITDFRIQTEESDNMRGVGI